MNANALLALIATILSSDWLTAIVALIAANFLLGVAVGLFTNTLNLVVIADWLRTRAAPYILGDLAFQVLLLVKLPAELAITDAISAAVHLAVCVALAAKILQQAAELGLPVPAIMRDRSAPARLPKKATPPPSAT